MVNSRHDIPSPGKRKARKGPTRVRLENDDRRRKLLELGVRLFSRHNYEELSIQSVAKMAGVSKGLLYHYFPTKREFYVESLSKAAQDLLRLTEAPGAPSPLAALRQGLGAYLHYVAANSTVYVSLLRGGIGADPEVASLVDGVRSQIINRMLKQSKIARPSPRISLGLRGWIGFVEHATIAWLEERCTSLEELQEILVNQFEAMFASMKADSRPKTTDRKEV